jgi:ribonuclease HI
VKGHANNAMNNRADELAVEASKRTSQFLIDEHFEAEIGLFS